MKLIELSRGLFAKVDDEDFDRLIKYKWHALKSKHNFYAGRHEKGKSYNRKYILMHRDIIPGCERVDHRDCDGLNNQKANLRPATQSQNMGNARKFNGSTSSKFKGVSYRLNKWRATIGVREKTRQIGTYHTELEAAMAYDSEAIKEGEYPLTTCNRHGNFGS